MGFLASRRLGSGLRISTPASARAGAGRASAITSEQLNVRVAEIGAAQHNGTNEVF